jgi:hypothetical protein
MEDIEAYLKEYHKISDFLKQYQPKNFNMTITPFETAYGTREKFDKTLEENTLKLKQTNPAFKEEDLIVVELNAKPTAEQLKDPQWREKVRIVHDAYIGMKRDLGYYFQPHKIAIFNQPLASGRFLAIGTTKTSIAKFWVGVGALKKTEDSFIEYIFSPKQLEQQKTSEEIIHIEGLNSKNFQQIRIV